MGKALRIVAASAMAVLLAALPLAHGLGTRAASAQTPKTGGTFVFGRGGDSVKLDPAVIIDGESQRVTIQVYDTLVKFDGATTNVVPALAESWETSSDGKTWTFNLRKGVKFHDGTDFNAQAALVNFERWRDKSNPLHKGGDFEYWDDVTGLADIVVSEDAVSDSVFRINLKEAQAPFITNLALFACAIASPAAMQKDVEGLAKNPVGTGAFKFAEWKVGDSITLEANPDYWGGRPYLDRVVIRTIKDNSARFLELKAGTIDGMEGLNPDDVAGVKSDPNLKLHLRPSLNIAYLNMNLKQKPFDDLRVRQALLYGIDRQAIVDALYGGTAEVASQMLPPSLWGHNPSLQPYPYDPTKAKQLLADAGYPNGFETDLWYMPVSRPYYPAPQPIAEAFAADLANIGVKATLKTEDWGAYLDDRKNAKFPFWMLGWFGDNGDPDNFMYEFFGNMTRDNTWDNAQVRDLLKQAQRELDQSKRDALYQQVATIVYAELPRLPIAHTTPPLAFQSYVESYVANPTATEYYAKVWLNK